jgi:hypothetical protein
MDGGILCYEMSSGENKVSFYDNESNCPPTVHPTEEMLAGYEYAQHGELAKHKENFTEFILKVRCDAQWSPKFNTADGIVAYLETQRDIDYPEFLKGMVVATREIEKVVPEFFKLDTIVCYGAVQFTMVTDTHAFALFSDNSTAAIGPSGVPVYAIDCTARDSVFAALKYAEEGQAHESTDIASAGGSYDRGADKKVDVSLFGDTLVSLGNGLSRRIDKMGNGETVLGLSETGLGRYESADFLMKKGVRETVKVVFMDGSSIVATPEHKFMLEDGTWCRADRLEGKYVRAGLKYTEDKVCNLEKDYVFTTQIFSEGGYTTLKMNNYIDREILLSYVRVLGFIFGIHKQNIGSSFIKSEIPLFHTYIDRLSWYLDYDCIGMLKWRLRTFLALPKYVNQYCEFIYDKKCPVSLKREFLAGYLGASSKIITDISDLDIDIIEKLGFKINSLREFIEQIGFRYNIRQTYNTELICSYKDYKNLNPNSKFTFGNYIYYMNVKNIRDDDKTIPYFRKKVISVSYQVPTEVFDIEVDSVHNFLANSVVVSN